MFLMLHIFTPFTYLSENIVLDNGKKKNVLGRAGAEDRNNAGESVHIKNKQGEGDTLLHA